MRRALVALGFALLAIGVWRSFPTVASEAPQAPALRVVLFDVSAGTTRTRPGHGLWARSLLREEARAALAAGEELAVGLYSDEVRSLGSDGADSWLARLEGRGGEVVRLDAEGGAAIGSELDAAVALFAEELRRAGRAPGRLIIAGLPDVTGPDPSARLARLAESGIAVEWRSPGSATTVDLALERIELPREPALGAPLVARVDVALVPDERDRRQLAEELELELALEVRSGGRVEARTIPLLLPLGPLGDDGVLRWTVALELGAAAEGRTNVLAVVRVRDLISGSQGDRLPENDVGSAECRSGEALQVVAVATEERQAALRAWIGGQGQRWPGLRWQVVVPDELSRVGGESDLIVAFDLGPRELPEAWTRTFVEAGGGLFFCGGWRALAGWGGASESGVGSLLPLAPREEDARPRDVIFFVDGSGSMAGGPFTRVQRALAGLVPALSAEDALSLQFFTGSPMAPIDLRAGEGGPREALERLFSARVPSGATAVLYSLEWLAKARAELERDGLVFLLSDGKDDLAYDVRRRALPIVESLTRGDSRFVVVAAGDDPDREFLSALLASGEVLHDAGGDSDLTEFFQREVFGRRLREGRFAVAATSGGALTETRDLALSWGQDPTPWPEHLRLFRCEARPGADLLVTDTEEGDPVLAWWRVGAGRVAAWASAPLDDWAPGYAGDDGAALLAPLLRRLARSDAVTSPRLVLRGERLVLEDVPLDWPPFVRARILAQLPVDPLDPGALEVALGEVSLSAAANGGLADPRATREAPLPEFLERRPGAMPLFAVLVEERTGEVLGQSGLDLPCAAELRPGGARRVDPRTLEAPGKANLAADGGDARPAPGAWRWLVAGLLALFAAAALGGLDGARRGLRAS